MGNRVWVQFHSDGSGGAGGFRFTATEDTLGCGGVLHGLRGNISSPREANGKYPNSAECIWEVRLVPGFHLEANFLGRFDLETQTDCANDYVQVQEYDQRLATYSNTGPRYCGREMPRGNITTASDRSRVVFRSNGEVNGDGFNVSKALKAMNTGVIVCSFRWPGEWLAERYSTAPRPASSPLLATPRSTSITCTATIP